MLWLLLAAASPVMATPSTHACPVANTTARQSVSPRIIVQGGIKPDADAKSKIAIGPKQDDPAGGQPSAASGTSMIAIGPKQDDPAASPASAKASGQSMLTIGPKQDDPAQPGRGLAASAMTDCGTVPAPVHAH